MTPPPALPLDEAQARLLAMAPPLPAELLPVGEVAGRYLAQPVIARRTQPPADLSSMDGYAMREDDLAGPWSVIGESAAGHPFTRALGGGEAVRISTGAPMPEGAGAVLLQENARREGGRLQLAGGDPTPGHIRRAGFDFRAGAVLLERGSRLGPAQIALAIAGGHGRLAVTRLPRVAILDSGDELAATPEQCGPDQIPASNGAMLAALAAPLASGIERIGPVPDRMDAMLAALDRAAWTDVLVTSGGASVGDHDLLGPALEKWGAQIDFWRVAIRPGKPLLVARRGTQRIVGLPGNPVSSYVTAFLFVLPLLRALAGAANPLPQLLPLRLDADMPAGGSRLELVRARLSHGVVRPLVERDSSALGALAASNALIRREIDAPALSAGGTVPAYLLENGGIA